MTTASPCINICRMTDDGEFCIGCFRTLDEIAAWSRLDEGGRQQVLAAVARRRADVSNSPENSQ